MKPSSAKLDGRPLPKPLTELCFGYPVLIRAFVPGEQNCTNRWKNRGCDVILLSNINWRSSDDLYKNRVDRLRDCGSPDDRGLGLQPTCLAHRLVLALEPLWARHTDPGIHLLSEALNMLALSSVKIFAELLDRVFRVRQVMPGHGARVGRGAMGVAFSEHH